MTMILKSTQLLLGALILHSVSSHSAFLTPQLRVSSIGRRHAVGDRLLLNAAPDKGDLYGEDELIHLLSLHQALNDGREGQFNSNEAPVNEEAIPGIHDLVLQTLDEIESSSAPPTFDLQLEEETPSHLDGSMSLLMGLLRDKKPLIRAIASDVDGTLLAGQILHPITLDAVLRAIDQSKSNSDQKIQHFFPATGKTRKGAAGSLGPILGPLLYELPGVYNQGLYCVDANSNVLFEKKLEQSAVKAAEDLVKEFGISIIGYDGDNLYSTELTDCVVELSEFYGEPTVELIKENGAVLNLAEHEPGMHKLLLMDTDVEKLSTIIRPRLEQLAKEHDATVTVAIPNMLELLPKGCSKAYGVQKVCEALGINAETELLALGDAENDVGMLKMASIGVAVGNACPQAKDAADFVMKESNEEGGAGLAMGLFGFDD